MHRNDFASIWSSALLTWPAERRNAAADDIAANAVVRSLRFVSVIGALLCLCVPRRGRGSPNPFGPSPRRDGRLNDRVSAVADGAGVRTCALGSRDGGLRLCDERIGRLVHRGVVTQRFGCAVA